MTEMNYQIGLSWEFFFPKESDDIEGWLNENVGERNKSWKILFFSMNGSVSFLNEEDMMAFKLVFSEYCL